jgi:cytochrome c556
MIDFWRQQHAADAVKWSEQGKAAAVELAAAAHAGNAGRATAAFQTISETCRACHEAHRETLAGGGYRIK